MEQINLYTPELHPKRLFLPAGWLAGGVLALLLLVAGGYGYLQWQSAALQARLQSVQRELETQRTRLEAKRVQHRSRQQAVQALEGEVAAVRSRLRALRQVGGVLQERLRAAGGTARVLEALGRASTGLNGVWLTEISLQGTTPLRLRLAGRTDRPEAVPAYLQRVAEQPVFRSGYFVDVTVGAGEEGRRRGGDAKGPLPFEAQADFQLEPAGGGS